MADSAAQIEAEIATTTAQAVDVPVQDTTSPVATKSVETTTTTPSAPKAEPDLSVLPTKEAAAAAPAPDAAAEPKKKEAPQPISFAPELQKPISQLTFRDILLYRNVYVSLFLFFAGQALYILLTRYNFTVLTLVGRIVLFQVLIFLLYNVGMRIFQNQQPGEQAQPPFVINERTLQPFVNALLDKVNTAIKFYVSILMCESLNRTLKFAAAVQVLCWLGNIFSGIHLLYLFFWGAFVIPKVYELKQTEIDRAIAAANAQIQRVLAMAQSKLPVVIDNQKKTQ